MSDDQNQVFEIFAQAIEIESIAERERFLNRICPDEDIRLQVEKLLMSHQKAGSFMEKPMVQLNDGNSPAKESSDNDSADSDLRVDDRSTTIGPYKLLQLLGEGGMGSVYMAEQEQPVKRLVALKIIKAGMDTKQVHARFEAERQALAMMEHPNIARLLDVGTTQKGQPYFVMELVKGVPITEYCDQNRLDLNQRLQLFTDVCKAVQHAHQKGIIHRDLKPTNILIAQYDDHVVPKVIDFGLAKALDQSLTAKTLFTQMGQILGTFAYMSPEQSKLNQLEVDTRSDIYSLGAILYELLTGTTPIEQSRLRSSAYDQLLKIIREEDPPLPSARLSSAADVKTAVSYQRQIDPEVLRKTLQGDLDWVVMRALEKERDRRYASASAFAEDIQRFLQDEAVLAHPPSLSYLTSKFFKKNRGLVAAMTAIALLITTAIVVAAVGWYATELARKRADRKSIEVTQQKNRADQESKRARDEAEKASRAEAESQSLKEKAEADLARMNYLLALERWEQDRIAEANEILKKIPNQYREFEWHYTKRKFLGSYRTMYVDLTGRNEVGANLFYRMNQHFDLVDSKVKPRATFNSDGTTIFYRKYGMLQAWDTETGLQHCLHEHWLPNPILTMTVSNDATKLASISKDRIQVFELVNNGNENSFDVHSQRIVPLRNNFSQQFRFGKRILQIDLNNSTATDVRFNIDGSKIAGAVGSLVKVFDADNGRELISLQGHQLKVNCVRFDSTSSVLASGGDDHTIRLWDTQTGQELKTLVSHTDPIVDICFNPVNSQIASASRDRVIIWDVDSGRRLRTLKGHADDLVSVEFSPDGSKIVTVSIDGMVKLWESNSGHETTLRGHSDAINELKVSPDGKWFATASQDHTVRIWDVSSGDNIRTFIGDERAPSDILAISPNSQMIASAGNESLRVRDVNTGAERWFCRTPGYSVERMWFSDDGECLFGVDPAGKHVAWSVENGRQLKTTFDSSDLDELGHRQSDFSWNSPDGLTVDVNLNGKRILLSGHHENVNDVSINGARTRLVSASNDHTVKVWDAANGQELQTLVGHRGPVASARFNVDGTLVLSAGADRTIKIWNGRPDVATSTLDGHSGRINKVCFSPDESLLASGSEDRSIKIWNTETKQELLTIEDHLRPISEISFSNDGKRLAATTDSAKVVKIWNVSNGELIQKIDCFTNNPATVLRFCNDDSRIVASGLGEFKIFDTETGAPIRSAKAYNGVSNNGDWMAFVERSAEEQWLVNILDVSTDEVTHSINLGKYEARIDAPLFFSFDLEAEKLYANSFQRLTVIDIQTGKIVAEDQVLGKPAINELNMNRRWRAHLQGDRIELIDLDLLQQQNDREYVDLKNRADDRWHRELADVARQSANIFAEMYHYAWALKANPDVARNYDDFQVAHRLFNEATTDQVLVILPMVVRQMLRRTRGNQYYPEDAQRYVNNVSHKLYSKFARTRAKFGDFELNELRQIAKQYPNRRNGDILALAEYRKGNFERSLQAGDKVRQSFHVQWHPPHALGIMAMASQQLGQLQAANQFRLQFAEEAKRYRKQIDNEFQRLGFRKRLQLLDDSEVIRLNSIQAEVDSLFAIEPEQRNGPAIATIVSFFASQHLILCRQLLRQIR